MDPLPLSVLQSLILQIAQNWIEQEKKETVATKEAYMAEHCPAPDLYGDQAALMVRGAASLWKSLRMGIRTVRVRGRGRGHRRGRGRGCTDVIIPDALYK